MIMALFNWVRSDSALDKAMDDPESSGISWKVFVKQDEKHNTSFSVCISAKKSCFKSS